jgi:hypothetical protein
MVLLDTLRRPRGRLAIARGVAAVTLTAIAVTLAGPIGPALADDPLDPALPTRTAGAAPGGFMYRDSLFGRGSFTRLRDVPGSQVAGHLGINDRGLIAGLFVDADAVPVGDGFFDTAHGFVQDRRGGTDTFDVPGATVTAPGGINDRGEVAGFWIDTGDIPPGGQAPPGSVGGFVRDRRGDIDTFEVPYFRLHNVSDINNRGQIVGYYDDPGLAGGGGFLRDRDGSFTDIRYPGASYTIIHGFNDRGQVVGSYLEAGAAPNPDGTIPRNAVHAFVWDDGRFTSFDVRGSIYTQAFGINNRGDIVGGYYDTSGRRHGFVRDRHGRSGNRSSDRVLDVPNGAGNVATGINDRGQIVLPDSRALALLPVAP